MVTLRIGLGLALLLPFWVAAIGWLSGRILGVRLGRVRAAFAATLGWILGVISTAVVLNGEDVGAGNLFLIVCFFAWAGSASSSATRGGRTSCMFATGRRARSIRPTSPAASGACSRSPAACS